MVEFLDVVGYTSASEIEERARSTLPTLEEYRRDLPPSREELHSGESLNALLSAEAFIGVLVAIYSICGDKWVQTEGRFTVLGCHPLTVLTDR